LPVLRRIRDKPTAPASPSQNGFAERLIGSIRRESVDHMIVLGEAHLRRILKSYARYYNGVKTHRSLNKDAPVSRSVQRTPVSLVHAPSLADFITIIVGFKFSVHTTPSAYIRAAAPTGQEFELPAWATLREMRNELIKLTAEIQGSPPGPVRDRALEAAIDALDRIIRF
jgi:hypothetical protein